MLYIQCFYPHHIYNNQTLETLRNRYLNSSHKCLGRKAIPLFYTKSEIIQHTLMLQSQILFPVCLICIVRHFSMEVTFLVMSIVLMIAFAQYLLYHGTLVILILLIFTKIVWNEMNFSYYLDVDCIHDA